MKCICNLDYNIRMLVNSLNKCFIIIMLIFALAALSGCGNKGPLVLPKNSINMNN